MEMILVRHGQPARVAQDPPLSDRGRVQALAAREALLAAPPGAVVASHLARAHQTAQPTADALSLSVDRVPDIAEVDGDGTDYVFVEDIRAEGGETWKRFLADPITAMGGNEAQFRSRTLGGFAHILERFADHDRVAVFTHGFPINVLLAHTLGMDSLTRFSPAHGSITRIGGSRLERLRVLSFNETAHLTGEVAP